MSNPSDPKAYTIGWICALSTEFTAAGEQFDQEYKRDESPKRIDRNDHNAYRFGKIEGHLVVIAVLPNGQYGTSSAAVVAKDMMRSFPNIRFGLMVGIGGGVPTEKRDIRLGDVVVSSPEAGQSGVFQYDFGRATKEGYQYRGSLNKPPQVLLAAVAKLKSQFEAESNQIAAKVDTIVNDPCHEFCVTAPTNLIDRTPRSELLEEEVSVHYGIIASGNTLMQDVTKRDELAKANILCFEMEAAGLMDGFPCLVIRGICDYCDSHKNDKWQGYAAMTAAVYAKQVLGEIRPEDITMEETGISKMNEGE
ncbi:hypothetical protein J7337_003299 [Fusarium musae]|uniref:Nucleoside phosphorylase domain-containing protein n=1 Tax=Fusarium musae TaxID=1042133 RepID=A0A9P8ISZ9_9HYPO|nr:hypothetical protein J7337_003299 [Fusarium musae]KAG9506316.1 hypothetical protein J7337_003299 [Fusarium musae]